MLGQGDDRVDHRLERTVRFHDGVQHDLFGELLGFRLDHQHAFLGAGDDEIQRAGLELGQGRVHDELAVEVAHARSADRAHEGHAGDGERGRGRDHRQDVGIVLEIVGERGHDDQRLVAIALVEQRTDRTIDQARGEDFLLARTTFTLEEAAGNLARGEGLLLVVHGQREEIEAGLRLLLEHHRGQHRGAAIGREHRAVGLARHLSGLEHQLAAGPVDFLAEYFEHV